jgi:hypothetical protein
VQDDRAFQDLLKQVALRKDLLEGIGQLEA